MSYLPSSSFRFSSDTGRQILTVFGGVESRPVALYSTVVLYCTVHLVTSSTEKLGSTKIDLRRLKCY